MASLTLPTLSHQLSRVRHKLLSAEIDRAEPGIVGSRVRAGAAGSNAVAESYFPPREKNVLIGQRWATRDHL